MGNWIVSRFPNSLNVTFWSVHPSYGSNKAWFRSVPKHSRRRRWNSRWLHFGRFCRFRIDNTDHILDVNKNPAEYDRVNIYCPRIARISSTSITESDSIYHYNKNQPAKDGYYIIYNVSKEEYETCRITNPQARRMLVCDNPNRLSYVTITFRPFTPQPNGPEFHAGNDYYFIGKSMFFWCGMMSHANAAPDHLEIFQWRFREFSNHISWTIRSWTRCPLELNQNLPNQKSTWSVLWEKHPKPRFNWKTES